MTTSSQLILFSLFLILMGCQTESVKTEPEVTSNNRFVDPFIGTGEHGHTYPGASVPFGMLQVSPDNGISAWDWCSGYHYSDSISIGISHLHLSGTGIGDLYDLRIMPISRKADLSKEIDSRDDLDYTSKYSHDDEIAEPGYYKVYFKDPRVWAEVTTDTRTAFHRYEYHPESVQSIIVDLGYSINWDKPTATRIQVVDKNTLTGYRHSTGWAKNQKVFFAIKFSKSIERYELVSNEKYLAETASTAGERTVAQLYFNRKNDSKLMVKVGISSVSIENALENMQEYKGQFPFDAVKKKANDSWSEQLGNIQVETERDSLKTIFYSALYHAQLAPVTFSDANGDFRLQNDSIVTSENKVYSTFSLWDTFRAEHPLLSVLHPDKVSDMVGSLLHYYDESGVLPVWTLYGNETNTMTGYHSIPVITEAYLKGHRGFDVEKAFQAMKETMMGDSRGLKFYKEYGYIPYNLLDESVTITLEYAYNDWCIAQMAKALGKEEDYTYFKNRSMAFEHLFDPETGFMRGLADDGKTWHEPFDPKFSAHRVHADYTEGNAWQHSWFVLHQPEKLVELHGGQAPFVAKLEQLFNESSEITGDNVSVDISGLIGQYAHGNEPSHHIAYLFNKAGQPWKTQYWVRQILDSQYSTQPEGLSGNEDCGQMSAWYVFSAIGLYPFDPVSTNYEIGSPIFDKTVIRVNEQKTFTISALNNSPENMYIQNAKLNGQSLNKTFIDHETLMAGGILELEMGPQPNKNWGN